jgi:hypothetical protein
MVTRRITALLVGVVMAVGLVAAPAIAKGPKAPADASIYDIVASNDVVVQDPVNGSVLAAAPRSPNDH